MIKIKYHVKNPEGIHARPAGILVNEFNKFKCNVIIKKNEKYVNAKDIFALMSLSVKNEDTLIIFFEGEEEKASAEDAEQFLKKFMIYVQ